MTHDESPRFVRRMTRTEARALQEWVVSEQWDEGEFDADVLYDIDPEGFWALLDDAGQIVGGLSIIASTDSIATVSHFYIKPEARGHGYARRSLPQLLEINAHRIHDDVVITNFCWPGAVETNAQWGFAPHHDELRMVLEAAGGPGASAADVAAGQEAEPAVQRADQAVDLPADSGLIDARTLGVAAIVQFDAAHAGRPRETLWRRWLGLPGATSLALLDTVGDTASELAGVGTIRPSALGYRVGPLMASTPAGARLLLEQLIARAGGKRVAMDVPTANSHAEPLARSLGFTQDFRTVRTVWGREPDASWHGSYATVMLHLD